MGSAHTIVVACIAVVSVACDRTDHAPTERSDLSIASDGVPVARVGPETIRAADVRTEMKKGGVGAEEALDALLKESLLVQEAQRRGFEESAADQRRIDRLMVRSFLKDLERNVTPETIPAEEVEADFETHKDTFQVPERRRSVHVLVKDQSDAARRSASEILRELRENGADVVVERYRSAETDDRGFGILAEELPPISEQAGFDPAFKTALFDATETGPLRRPVKTSFGWHAVVLTEIQPGERRTLKDVEGEIRSRLAQKGRFEQLVRLVERLEAEVNVRFNETGVQSVLGRNDTPR